MMPFSRLLENNLKAWSDHPSRKPLIIRGARQVGKTTLVRNFAKNFRFFIMLNLEKASDLEWFEKFDEPKTIIESLFLSRNISIADISETLLFVDEIQESPKAIQMLRYFYEDFPILRVIAAGSLLEFAMKKLKSFPVGRVEFMHLYPMNFIEYLTAIKHGEALKQINRIPIEPFAHTVLLGLFNNYAIVGGMPEAIRNFAERKSMTDLPVVYDSIWSTLKKDMEKYAGNQTERNVIRHVMSTAHLYIDQRIKFQHFGQSNYRSREVREAFRNLDDARVVQLIYPTTDTKVPIKPDMKKSPRMQFLDTGLLNHELGIQAELLSYNDLSDAYRGTIIPHLVTQELFSINTTSHHKPHFWVRDKKQSSAEVDLVYSYHGKVIPIEIKSGKTGSLRSLHQFLEHSEHPYAIRIYGGEFSVVKTGTPGGKPYLLMNLPYYLGTKIPEYVRYFVEQYKI